MVAFQFPDQFQKFILADCRWAAEFHAFHAHLDIRLALVPNIYAAGRILTHQHHRESGLSARLRRKGLHPRGHLFAQLRGKGLAIDNPSDSHASPANVWSFCVIITLLSEMRTRFNREISPASMEIAIGGQSSAFASNLMSAALALPFYGTARTLAQSQDASFASGQMPPMPSFADRGVSRIDKSKIGRASCRERVCQYG